MSKNIRTEELKKIRAAQNARQKKSRSAGVEFGITRLDLSLSKKENETLVRNCQLRGGYSGAYSKKEYIATLIRQDDQRLKKQLNRLDACHYCKKQLPEGCEGVKKGELMCWLTKGEKRLRL